MIFSIFSNNKISRANVWLETQRTKQSQKMQSAQTVNNVQQIAEDIKTSVPVVQKQLPRYHVIFSLSKEDKEKQQIDDIQEELQTLTTRNIVLPPIFAFR